MEENKEKYIRYKNVQPIKNVLLGFEVAEGYVFFKEDAKIAERVLGIKATTDDDGWECCVVPEQLIMACITELAKKGYMVGLEGNRVLGHIEEEHHEDPFELISKDEIARMGKISQN